MPVVQICKHGECGGECYKCRMRELQSRIEQCAAGPWRPMEELPRNGKAVLLLGESRTLALGAWDEDSKAWYLDDSTYAPSSAFIAWAEIFVPEEWQ